MEAEKRAEEYLTDEHRLANVIHELTCKFNHESDCSWYYEFDGKVAQWSAFAHENAFKRAQAIVQTYEHIEIKDIINIFELAQYRLSF